MRTTWQPYVEYGKLDTSDRRGLPDSAFAFPDQRKEPLTDASHVRNALARFNQVEGVGDEDRQLAFANIQAAARYLASRFPSMTGGSSDVSVWQRRRPSRAHASQPAVIHGRARWRFRVR
jgi:hypothetical protein